MHRAETLVHELSPSEVGIAIEKFLLLLLPRRYSPIRPRPPLMRLLNLTLIDSW
jgi:hypothetical protein